MGGIRQPLTINTPECISRTCVLEAFDPAEDMHAVPFDRLEVVQSNRATVYVPANKTLNIRIMDLDGNILNERPIPIR